MRVAHRFIQIIRQNCVGILKEIDFVQKEMIVILLMESTSFEGMEGRFQILNAYRALTQFIRLNCVDILLMETTAKMEISVNLLITKANFEKAKKSANFSLVASRAKIARSGTHRPEWIEPISRATLFKMKIIPGGEIFLVQTN